MTLLTRLIRGAVIAATLTIAALVIAAPAWAHVKVTADHTWRGGVAILTFYVPNESETGSPTTQLSVALPNVTSAHTEVMPGWTAQLDHDVPAGVFRSVTWTAAPNTGIPADQFAQFRVEVTLPDSDTASFPATQTYADGKVVRTSLRCAMAMNPNTRPDAHADRRDARGGEQHQRAKRPGTPPGDDSR